MSHVRFSHAKLFSVAAVVCLSSCALFAQSDNGSIVGYVKDPTGAVIPKAKVLLKNEATGVEKRATTNDSGYYVVSSVASGYYTISAEATGFKKVDVVHNKLDADTTLSVDVNMLVGAASETVEVSASAQTLQTESAQVGKLITRGNIDGLEINGRNPLFLASLVPGMRSGSTLGDFNFSLTSGGYAVNGARSPDTTITFDGAPAVRTRANGTSIGVADMDSTEEMQVLTGSFDAEYGRASGGQIRIVTKGGSQQFHGAAYEYFRNSAMNANTWSRNTSTLTNFASPFRYNQFGFNIGGPVIIPHVIPKGKVFFYVGEEWARYRNVQTNTYSVPSALMHQGNFSELLGSNIWYGGSKIIYQPSTCPSVGAASCVPFPGNVIPQSQWSHNGAAILSVYPLPNTAVFSGNQNWILALSQPENQRKDTWNGDILPTDKDRIQARHSGLAYYELDPFDQPFGIGAKSFNRPNQTNSITWTHTFTPTLLNEFRATQSLDVVHIPVVSSEPAFNRQEFGINYQFLLPVGKDEPNKIPTVTVPNFSNPAGGPYPSHSTGPIYTLNDSITKVWGNHTFKAGFYWERSGENDGDQINVSTVPGGSSNQNGTFTFTDARTGLGATSGVGLANMLLGLADSYTEIGQRAYTLYRGFLYEWYAQDSWKVNQKLSINYGIRQTITIPYHALWGNQIFFDPALYNPATAPKINPTTGNVIAGTGNVYDGMVIPGNAWPSNACGHGVTQACGTSYNSLFQGLPDYYGQINYQFQPRVGIAYSLNDKTVIRAGAGRYLTRFGLLDNIFPGANSPFQPFVTVSNVSVDNPGAALTGAATPPLTVTTLARNNRPPSAWNWNFTVQRQIFFKSILEVAYVGHRGLNLPEVFDINQPQVGALQANPGVNVNALRPYPGYASIQEEENVAQSWYHALQISWNRRFASGLAFGFSYTLSSSTDNNSNYRDIVPDTYNTSNLWGPSEFNSTHAIVFNYLYNLPFFKDTSKLSGKLLGGWQISGVNQFQTGTPCGIGTNNDYAGVGEVGSFGCGSEGQFYVINGPITYPGQFNAGGGSTAHYFNVTVPGTNSPLFTIPAAGTFNLQKGVRNSVYQPGFQNWNLSLFKSFVIHESHHIEFRAEAFDVNNHPNWSTPNLNPTASTFGEVTSKTNLARNLQLSLRYAF
jgi:Carboxypeptidase regulatory-like domain/TonB-dependent Receptor Plug Domain